MARQLARFEGRITVLDNGCHRYVGKVNPDGYGLFNWWWPDGSTHSLAHRFALALELGRVPLIADHRCHNEDPTCPGGRSCLHRLCVRPDHLHEVTQRQNLAASNAVRTRVGRRPDRPPVRMLEDGRRVGRGKVSASGTIWCRRRAIHVGSERAGQDLVLVVDGDDVEVWDGGELVRRLTLDLEHIYQPSHSP